MKLQSHFLRFATLPTTSLLSIIAVGALSPVFATALQGESDAERFVLVQAQKGEAANLRDKYPVNVFPESQRKLRGSFIAKLLTRRDLQIHPHGIWIEDAVITGELDLINQDIPYDVSLNCTFDGLVDLTGSHFAKGLNLTGSELNKGIKFSDATIDFDFLAAHCQFSNIFASFRGMRVGRDFVVEYSTFNYATPTFQGVRVGGAFFANGCKFARVSFADMRVDGRFAANDCTFTGGEVVFTGARLVDVFLNRSTFDMVSTIDFSGMQADSVSFDEVQLKTPSKIKVDQMTFKLLRPLNAQRIQFLLSKYNAEFFTDLETSFRTHGYPEEADKIFIAKKRAERRENCKSFLHQCQRGAWALSIFEDALAGYGKSLQNLLYWSLGFLVIGTIVFRSEKGMRTRDAKNAEHYEGSYHSFWYSLDLFLPIIKLGEADVWTPKHYRRWANRYRKVHIIIGSLFVPIGLAAWTGIIK